MVPTPDPKHLVCDKDWNILCFLKYVVGVVMAGVTDRRMLELIRAYMVLKTWVLSCNVCVARKAREMVPIT